MEDISFLSFTDFTGRKYRAKKASTISSQVIIDALGNLQLKSKGCHCHNLELKSKKEKQIRTMEE